MKRMRTRLDFNMSDQTIEYKLTYFFLCWKMLFEITWYLKEIVSGETKTADQKS